MNFFAGYPIPRPAVSPPPLGTSPASLRLNYRQQHERTQPRRHFWEIDPYLQLMSKKEKEWLTRIQQNSLHIEDPMRDDYYWTVKEKKNKAGKFLFFIKFLKFF